MQSSASMCQTSADASLHDLLEVERLMASVVESGDEAGAQAMSVAKVAAFYHLNSGGQRIRSRLALDSAHCLGLTARDGIVLAATAELLHNASLIHDDLQDRDQVRRDCATVWVAYGDEVAICAGDLLMSAGYAAVACVSCVDMLPLLVKLVHSRITQAIGGQCAEFSPASVHSINTDRYLKIATAKSGALLGLPVELALLAGGYHGALHVTRATADSFAAGYQIYDDLCDFEIDLARDAAAPVLNIVLVLQKNNASSIHDAWKSAQKLGLMHLEAAAASSTDLPRQSGRLFREMANDLHARLKRKCVQ